MPVKISAANMWVTIFIEIMQVGVSVTIMQVVFSTLHYAHDYFYCNYAGGCFHCSHVCESFKQQIYILFSNLHQFFIKLTRKLKGIISSLHFTTLINIFLKLRYFVRRIINKLVERYIQYFCFPDRSIRGGDILDFQKGGNLRKGGGRMISLTNYAKSSNPIQRVPNIRPRVYKFPQDHHAWRVSLDFHKPFPLRWCFLTFHHTTSSFCCLPIIFSLEPSKKLESKFITSHPGKRSRTAATPEL